MTTLQILPRIAGEGDRAQRGGGGESGLRICRQSSDLSQPFDIARALAPSTASRSPSPAPLRFSVEDFQ
jgi:hypothetical protein